MGSVFRPLYDYNKEIGWRSLAWIGPDSSLVPVSRKSLSTKQKMEVLIRQNNKCRFCKSGITIIPYCNADADHIIPISQGGETNLNNIQLLCVGCHRHKTSLENSQESRIVYFPKQVMNKGEIYIVYTSKPKISLPMNTCTPIEINGEDDTPLLLSYSKKRRGMCIDYDYDMIENIPDNIFDQFRYTG